MAEWQRRRSESQISTWSSDVGYKLGAADECKMVELLCYLLQDILGGPNWLLFLGATYYEGTATKTQSKKVHDMSIMVCPQIERLSSRILQFDMYSGTLQFDRVFLL